ncbi:MAG: nickel-dependent lactate racemase [Phycisphaerae bacterium]|nr:nickel-dependent lactate racemase [Phycisphaerae bacterium]
MNISLAYDTTGLAVDLPDHNVAAVLRHSPAPPLADPAAALTAAIAKPTGGKPLLELARGRRNACVLICDHTRPAPDRLMLPPILATLERAGIARKDILILIATGLHRPSSPAEIERLAGPDVARDYRIENHVARDAAAHDFCCVTSDGTRASVDRRFLAADLKIATGFVEPHLMAGFGGGRKMVAIGVASADTICQLHSPRVLENRNCREGNLPGNVLHEAATEIARAAGLEFIVHVTLDEQKRVTGAFAGDPTATFHQAVAVIRAHVSAKLDRPCDIAITSGGGFPLDATYYQTIKGVTAAIPAVKPGGTILVASGCREGLGSEEFQKTLGAFPDFASFRAAILDPDKPYFLIDQWQHEQMSQAMTRAEVVIAESKLTPDQRAKLWVRSTDNFSQALSVALARHGPDATIAVLPQGPYVLVECDQ